MKNLLNHAVIEKKENYLSLLIILAPLLNFLTGITFDLHAPSLPAIATYFSAASSDAKNTITIALLGFTIGSVVFGTLLDIFGRRPVILWGLLIYTAVSFTALMCSTIQQLLLVRGIQGFAVASLSIGCRTIVLDNFSGHQFKVAMLYTSLAFGLGPIIAPFLGGYIQYHFGWKANFIAYGLASFILMVVFFLYISESKKEREPFSLKNVFLTYTKVIKQPSFFPGVLIGGLSQVELIIYTTTGAFIIENVLHRSAIAYGNSALVVSCGYLFGTLTNRFLIKHFVMSTLIQVGFLFLLLGIVLQIIFSFLEIFNLFTLIFPITLIGFSQGFIFINTLTCCMGMSRNAGVTAALFTSGVMAIGTLGTGIVSHMHTYGLGSFALMFGICALGQFVVYLLFFRKITREIE